MGPPDFAAADDGKMPLGKPAEEWSYGDLDGGFKAKVIVERKLRIRAARRTTRWRRAPPWPTGRAASAIVHGSNQSHTVRRCRTSRACSASSRRTWCSSPSIAAAASVPEGTGYPLVAISATALQEGQRPPGHAAGVARGGIRERLGPPGFQGWTKIGFAENGRITALDVFVVQDNGPNIGFWDFRNVGETASDRLSTGGDALARHAGAHQHAAARSAARSGREPDRR